MPEIISTSKAPKAPPTYSQAVNAEELIFVSGTAPVDPATGQLIDGGAAEQTAQCLHNISAILEAACSRLEKAVSATIIFNDPDDFLCHQRGVGEVVSHQSTRASGREAAGTNARPEGLDRYGRRSMSD